MTDRDIPEDCLETARESADRRLAKSRKIDPSTVEWVENDIARALGDERDKCCKAVCEGCEMDWPITAVAFDVDSHEWMHTSPAWAAPDRQCTAWAIRERSQ